MSTFIMKLCLISARGGRVDPARILRGRIGGGIDSRKASYMRLSKMKFPYPFLFILLAASLGLSVLLSFFYG